MRQVSYLSGALPGVLPGAAQRARITSAMLNGRVATAPKGVLRTVGPCVFGAARGPKTGPCSFAEASRPV